MSRLSPFAVLVGGVERPGMPTPWLISQGGGEAYFVPTDEKRVDGTPYDGTWYGRDDAHGHVSPDGKYERVRVAHRESYRADFSITVVEDGQDPYTYDDTFYVEAIDRANAERLALDAARDDIDSRFGEDVASDIRIIRVVLGDMFS